MTTITIGPLTLPEAPAGGDGFWFEKLTDWYTVPTSKIPVTSRPQADGSFRIAHDWRDAATVTVEGHYGGNTPADVINAIDTLHALAGGNSTTVTVTDAVRATSREVSVRTVTVPDHRGRLTVDFAIDMIAPDPKRYAPAVTVQTGLPTPGTGITYPITYPITYGIPGDPGRVVLVNGGNADTYPTFEVSGGLDAGFALAEVGSGREVRFGRVVPLGSVVVLNPRTGRAFLDVPGNDVSGSLVRSDWFAVPAGGSTVVQFTALGASSGSPVLTVRTASAFW